MSPTAFVDAPWYLPPVSSVLVVPPTVEPLTLAEAKLRAGLDWATGDPRDALMTGFIAAARQQVEMDTGLALLTQTRAITFHATGVVDATDCGILPLPMQSLPLQSLTDPDGNPFDPLRYASGYQHRLSAVQFYDGWQSGTWMAVAGWPDVDALKADAPLLVHAVGLLVAHYATVGRDLSIVGTIVADTPMAYKAAINPFCLVTLA